MQKGLRYSTYISKRTMEDVRNKPTLNAKNGSGAGTLSYYSFSYVKTGDITLS